MATGRARFPSSAVGGFEGFRSGDESTPVPERFLSELLPEIKDEAELRLSLYLLWRLQRLPGYPRAIREPELVGEAPVAGPESRRGLALALRRGTFLAVEVGAERWIALNDEAGRRWREAVGRGEAPPPEVSEDGAPNVFRLYEAHIGLIQPALVEELKEAEASYPADWIEEAFQIAVESEARSWRYVASILKRWEREGKDRGTGKRHPDPERLRRPGKYADYVES